MSDKFEWKKVDVKDFWKHTKPKVHKSKKKYNRKKDGFKRTKETDY
tara:strand:- start:834 stop:971 length:138 start_codon:yes stop_codon:yes gene_type:complete